MAYFWILTRGGGAENLVPPKCGSRCVAVRLPADLELHDQLNRTSLDEQLVNTFFKWWFEKLHKRL